MHTAVARPQETIDQKESKLETSQFWKDDIHDRILYIFQKVDSSDINLFVQITRDDWSMSRHSCGKSKQKEIGKNSNELKWTILSR